MKKTPFLWIGLCCSIIIFPLNADIRFTDHTLFSSSSLLFTAEASFPGFGSYKSLFLTDITTKKTVQLTFFPENMCYLEGRGVLQIQNRFGVFRSDAGLKTYTPLSLFPAFVNGSEIQQGKITPVITSPDGKYLVYYKPTSSAFGNLMLLDLAREGETVISEKVPLSLDAPPVIWSPNSRIFIYGKNFRLYYFSIDHLEKNRSLSENYRNIATGNISSVRWDAFDNLYYVDGMLVFKIEKAELFTRAVYSGSLDIGTIVGKMPFEYAPNLDRFWISPDGTKIILNKGQQSVFFFYLVHSDFSPDGAIKSMPHLFLPRSILLKKVLWPASDHVTLLAEGIEKGEKVSTLFRLSVLPDKTVQGFNQVKEDGIADLIPSKDGKRVLLLKKDRVEVYDYAAWKKETDIAFISPLHVLWKADNEVIIGGAKTIELHDFVKKTSTFLTLSQPETAGFSTDGTTVLARNDGKVYASDLTEPEWKPASSFSIAETTVTTADYRVYIEDIERGNYKNMLMIRDLEGLITAPLFPYKTYSYEDFPEKEEPTDFTYFNHGSRIRRREVAIVFNAVYSTEGLSSILTILKDYGIHCTFFVNGEFIRRFPDAAKEIAASGHEVGSLFYAHFDMTDARFTVDTEFIKKGLARNEDEYFQATGKELALLWHAPYYFINSSIIEASKQMNYSYVGRDVDSLDWVGKSAAAASPESYFSAVELIERIINLKKPGSIITIELGVPVNNRDDYLFQYFDVLVNALTRLGYEIVPVSTLIEHAK